MTTGLDVILPDHLSEQSTQRQQLERLWWAIVLIWAGLVLAAEKQGFFPVIGKGNAWSWIFLGGGIAALLGALIREFSPSVPEPNSWDWFWSGFCLIVGLGGFSQFRLTWPLILILAGCFLFARIIWH